MLQVASCVRAPKSKFGAQVGARNKDGGAGCCFSLPLALYGYDDNSLLWRIAGADDSKLDSGRLIVLTSTELFHSAASSRLMKTARPKSRVFIFAYTSIKGRFVLSPSDMKATGRERRKDLTA